VLKRSRLFLIELADDDHLDVIFYIENCISGSTGWVFKEVFDEYLKYRKNAPDQDRMDQALSAIRATAHK